LETLAFRIVFKAKAIAAAGPMLVYVKLVMVAAIWGGTFVVGRIVSADLPPLIAACGRYGVAAIALCLLTTLSSNGWVRLTRREVIGTALLGLTGIYLYNLGFFYALSLLPAGRTSLLVSLNPIITLLGALAFLGERLTLTRAVGVALAFCGVFIVLSRGDPSSLLSGGIGLGELVMFGAVCAWAAYTLIGRSLLTTLSPFVATTYATLWGTLFLGVTALLHGQAIPPQAWSLPVGLGFLFLGLFGTVVAFIWFYDGVQSVGAGRAAVFTNLVPVFAVAQSAIFLGEPILPSMVLGGGIAILGVILASHVV
jgi:drug/metabolite transporter (DMT)-like permease